MFPRSALPCGVGSVIAPFLRVRGRTSPLPALGLEEQAVRLRTHQMTGQFPAALSLPARATVGTGTPSLGQGGAVPTADHCGDD